MRNLVFVIWMLGYPLVVILDTWLNPGDFSITVRGLAAIITIVMWFGVGYLLYEKKP